MRKKLRMRWFFDVSKVKESSFFNRTSLTLPQIFDEHLWKISMQALPAFIFQFIFISRSCFESDDFKAYSNEWDWKEKNDVFSHWSGFNQIILYQKVLTIGLFPHAPVAQKIADQRWLIANSAKIKYLFIYNDVTKGWLVWINIVFIISISFVRISYKTIWIKTWSWYEDQLKNEIWKGLNRYFPKDTHQNLRGGQCGPSKNVRSKHLLWNININFTRNLCFSRFFSLWIKSVSIFVEKSLSGSVSSKTVKLERVHYNHWSLSAVLF